MKYIKTFESTKKFKIDSYVIASYVPYKKDIKYFLENNIGKIVKIVDDETIMSGYLSYVVHYENIPSELKFVFNNDGNREMYSRFLRYASKKEIEEYKLKTQSNKFNL